MIEKKIEMLDIVDENENIIGEAPRYEVHTNGLLHREIHVWLYTPKGKIIFQKRSKTKDTYPDLLDASVGGHIDQGFTPIQAALAELEEEAGISEKENNLNFVQKDRNSTFDPVTNTTNNVIRYIYSYCYSGDLKMLSIEDGQGQGFFEYTISELHNFAKEEHKMFISTLLNDEYLKFYKKLVD